MNEDKLPRIGASVVLDDPEFIHPTAILQGKIYIGQGASIFPYVVMRAETHEIRVGARSNIQDMVMVHIGDFTPTIIGDDCSITHQATLHGCTIGDNCLIGIKATIMDGAVIGKNSIVAGHALVKQGSEFSANSVIAGIPATKIGERDNSDKTLLNSLVYQKIATTYARGEDRLSTADLAAITAFEPKK